MSKPKAVIFFSGQGGACRGYEMAGFDVVAAVDLNPQPHYVRPERFVQGDALEIFWDLIEKHRPAFAGGSPPCQRKTKCQKIQGREHPALIAPFRKLLLEWGGPYVIENVVPEGEDDDPLIDPVMLCGAIFPGLRTYRHRLFESNVPLTVPEHTWTDGPTVKMGRPLKEGDWYHAVGNFSGVPYVKRNMGVPWMTRDGIKECIPPVYAEFIGKQVLEVIT
jgi:DNA (cytosine-5)-methyltransferase 1